MVTKFLERTWSEEMLKQMKYSYRPFPLKVTFSIFFSIHPIYELLACLVRGKDKT